ncbi:MAG: hypothetical protein LBD84_03150 [Campylobacteraceae bacterium]|jgi:hypothetical protein|nr:hypothetical protein [Campylobacteraceae bacterium]
MKTLSKLLVPFILSIVVLTGCGGGSEKNTSVAPTIYVNFYDNNLDLIETVKVNAELYNLSDLQSGYTWYIAESNLPITNYNITQNINFYTVPNVYEIQNETQLYNIRDDLSGNYILINDISLTNETLDEISGWDPIGAKNNPFSGIFNGNRHKVTDFFINNTIKLHVGFFGYIDGGVVKNFGIEISEKGVVESSPDISFNRDIGSIAGIIDNGVIANCYSMGNIVSNRGTVHMGGIAGGVSNTFISNCYTAGNITMVGDWSAIGGIVAYAGNSTINNCYSTRDITITEGNHMFAGGIVGYVGGIYDGSEYVGGTSISNCYSIGNISVSGWINAGGIAGHNENGISIISNCAAINGNIRSDNGNRILAGGSSTTTLTNNFANSAMLLNGAVVGNSDYNGIGKTLAELQTQYIYKNKAANGGLGWKFGNDDDNPWAWNAFEDYPYPTLYWQTQKP